MIFYAVIFFFQMWISNYNPVLEPYYFDNILYSDTVKLLTFNPRLFFLMTFLYCSLCQYVNAKGVDLRFSKESYDPERSELYVNIDIRVNNNESITLGGQNYRIYYSSEVLELDETSTTSFLSSDSYSSVSVLEHISGIMAGEIGQLSFDDDLGLVNFSVLLNDLIQGGLTLTEEDGWVSLSQLKFKVKQKGVTYDIVWGREGVTDRYATAFVEMAALVGDAKFEKIHIDEYVDLSSEEKAESSLTIPTVSVGPNPTVDYVNIWLERELKRDAVVNIRDLSGTIVQSKVMSRGSVSSRIDLVDLTTGSYIVDMSDSDNRQIYRSLVMVIK